MPKRWGAVLIVAAGMCAAAGGAWAQEQPAGFPAKLAEAPATLPEGCAAAVVAEVGRAQGTAAYRALHREVAALRLGHEASEELEAALGPHGSKDGKASADKGHRPGSKGGNSPGGSAQHDVIQAMTGLTHAQNTYLCASFVEGQGGEGAEFVREQMLSVYNRMALEAWRLENSVVMATAGGAKGGDARGGADSAAAILEDRKRAGADLMEAVMRGEAQAIDGGRVRMTCGERSGLLAELAAMTKSSSKDEFTTAAELLEDFLKQPYRCEGKGL
jgi:hypothetical protein